MKSIFRADDTLEERKCKLLLLGAQVFYCPSKHNPDTDRVPWAIVKVGTANFFFAHPHNIFYETEQAAIDDAAKLYETGVERW